MELKVRNKRQAALAQELINNGKIYGKCSHELKELIYAASRQNCLMEYDSLGEKVFSVSPAANPIPIEACTAYCLPDNIEISVGGDDLCDRLNDIILDAEDTDTFCDLGEIIKELHVRITILENNHKNLEE